MEMRVANKKDVWHLVQRGELTQFHFDFEGYGLKTQFSQIMSYGDAVGDLAGNFAETHELHVKRPDRYVPTPQALLVTRTPPSELDDDKNLPHRVAMAKIAQRFENSVLSASQFGFEEEGKRDITTIRKYGEDLYPKDHSEPVIHYPLFDPDKKMQIGENGEIITDPPGMLKLNDKGQVVFGPEEKVITIPHEVRMKQPDGKYNTTYVYKPMTPEDGAITFDVRIHPKRNMIAYRFDDDPKSPYYENIENGYYHDTDGNGDKWKFTDPRLDISFYRGKWYDIPMLRTALTRAGFHPANIFFTHSKSTISNKQKPKNYAVDAYSVALNTHLFGPQGEEGLKIGMRTDARTGQDVPSAKLELLAAGNSRYENKERGVRAGMFMAHDKSLYDGRKGHKSPAYDAIASFSLYNYCRELAPGIVKQQELQADEDYLREMLPGNNLLEKHPPIFAMMRNSYPDAPVADPVAFIGFDDQQGQLRRAVTLRLDMGNLQNFTYKGKTLLQMAKEDLAQRNKDPSNLNFVRMIKEQGRDPDSLIRVDSLRKFHGVARMEDAMHTESARNWDLEEVDDNFRYIFDKEDHRIRQAILEAVDVLNWEMRAAPPPANPRLEEEWPFNSFGDIDFLEFEARSEIVKHRNIPRTGQTKGVVQLLYETAMDVFKYHNTVDELLHRVAIQPQPIDLYGYDETLDTRAAIDSYWDMFKKVHERLKAKNSPYVHIFDEFFDEDGKLMPPGMTKIEEQVGENKNGDPKMKKTVLTTSRMSDDDVERAVQKIQDFRWGMMRRMLDDDELERNDKRSDYSKGLFDHKYSKKGRLLFGNLSRDFRIIDDRGRELSIEYLKRKYAHQPHIVQEHLESKKWRVQFYRQTSEPTTSVILMQFADMGRMQELPKLWQHRYAVLRSLYLYGPPNEDATNMRWDAIPVLERALLALEANHTMEDDGGLARVFSRHVSGEAEIFLRSEEGQRFLAEYKDYLEQVKKDFPPMESLQYDPETNLPYDWIEFEINPDDYVVIDVPDPHLRAPLEDTRQAPYSLVVRSVSEADRKRIGRGTPVILRGMQTGRLYHPGRASIHNPPSEKASYSDYFNEARTAYKEEADVPFPKHENRQVLRVQALIPVANSRAVNARVQSLKVPAQHFDGLVSPRLAYFNDDEPLTGLVLPADYCPQELKAGKPIRFREMEASMGGKMQGAEGRETGHTYETKLKKVRRLTVGQLHDEVMSGKIKDDQARRYGYAGAHDMWEKINGSFLDRESPNIDSEEILLLDFAPVDKKSWAYFNPPEAPRAAFVREGEVLSPSVYRMTGANDNRKHETKKGKVVVPKQPGTGQPQTGRKFSKD